jgi:hypothetical protein
MRRGSSGSAIAIIAGSVLLLIVGVIWTRRSSEPPPAPPRSAAAPAAPPASAAKAEPVDQAASATQSASAPRPKRAEPDEDPFADNQASRGTWEALDMDDVRAAMPDNVYWKMAAPTQDPDLIKWREEERARWNVEYGKVLSNTATAEEIDAYYAERKRLSDDYLEFVVYVLANYGNAIPREGAALLKLAGEMHALRLEEMPRQMAEAHERREAHDAARRAWLEEQKAFEEAPSETP